MEKSCPQTLYHKPYTINPKSGFTLIELLVVMGIIAILVGGSIAAYRNFNQTQILNQATETLKTNLRNAQNRALSGEKNCGACISTPSGCGLWPLNGWYMRFTSPMMYNIYGSCGSPTGYCGASILGSSATFNWATIMPNGVTISPASGSTCILFRSLTRGAASWNNGNPVETITITLTLTGTSKTRTVTITSSGEIY